MRAFRILLCDFVILPKTMNLPEATNDCYVTFVIQKVLKRELDVSSALQFI